MNARTKSLPSCPTAWFHREVSDDELSFSLRRLSGPEFAMLAPELVDIYLTAMDYDPAIRMQRVAVWRREVIWPGFSAFVALRHRGSQPEIVGIAYGFLGSRDRWWDRQLIRGLRQHGGPTTKQYEMLNDYFEVAEVHVHPSHQGTGIGQRMLRELLNSTSATWALLSTPEVPGESNRAFGLYRKMGFDDILRDFHYEGDPRAFAVLGRQLPLLPNR